MQEATDTRFIRYPVSFFADWHIAPRRMYAIIISGRVECEIGDGTLRRWGSEDVVLQEDRTGQGHTIRVVNDPPLMVAFVRT